MNWNVVMFRGVASPLAVCLVAFVFAHFAGRLGAAFASQDMIRIAALLPIVGIAVALGWLAVFGWRLRKWERGIGLACPKCSGPLGGVREGRLYRGRRLSDYRRCYNCGGSSPETM